MNKQKTKNTTGSGTDRNAITVRAPFKLEEDEKRRFIRIEITDPLNYSVLKDRAGSYWPKGDGPSYTGSILNISAGGVLIVSQAPLQEGTLVIITMNLQDVEVIKNVIGIVKRSEQDENDWLIGIEFITRESLVDYMTSSEFDMIPDDVRSFDQHLREILNNYVTRKRISKEG